MSPLDLALSGAEGISIPPGLYSLRFSSCSSLLTISTQRLQSSILLFCACLQVYGGTCSGQVVILLDWEIQARTDILHQLSRQWSSTWFQHS